MHTPSLEICEHIQVENTLRTMHALDELSARMPDVPSCVFTNALLNLAIERLLRECDSDKTARALHRLAALIGARIVPGSKSVVS